MLDLIKAVRLLAFSARPSISGHCDICGGVTVKPERNTVKATRLKALIVLGKSLGKVLIISSEQCK